MYAAFLLTIFAVAGLPAAALGAVWCGFCYLLVTQANSRILKGGSQAARELLDFIARELEAVSIE